MSEYCEPPASASFGEDFERFHGRRPDEDVDLHHWCPDWDFLPIDSTSTEFRACCCEWRNPEIQAAAHAARTVIAGVDEDITEAW